MLYLSLDRPSIQFAMAGIAFGMAKPTVLHNLRLKRLGRYLAKYTTQTWVKGILVYTGTQTGVRVKRAESG